MWCLWRRSWSKDHNSVACSFSGNFILLAIIVWERESYNCECSECIINSCVFTLILWKTTYFPSYFSVRVEIFARLELTFWNPSTLSYPCSIIYHRFGPFFVVIFVKVLVVNVVAIPLMFDSNSFRIWFFSLFWMINNMIVVLKFWSPEDH